jgi:hypothetical protein
LGSKQKDDVKEELNRSKELNINSPFDRQMQPICKLAADLRR